MNNRNKHGRMLLLALLLSLFIGLIFTNYSYQQADAAPLLGDDMEDVSDWTLVNPSNGSMTTYAGASQVLQGSYSMNFRVTDNNNGVNDAVSVYKAYSPNLNLNSHDVMSLWIQTDTLNPYLEVQLTDSDGTVSKIILSMVVRGSNIPAEIKPDKWYQVFWHFKENIGVVSGGDGVMNYAAIQKVTLSSTDGRPAFMKTAQTNFYIDDLNFYADSDLYSSTQIDAMETTSAWLTTALATLASSSAQVKQGSSSIKFTATNNNNGSAEYPSLYRTNVNYNLSGSYELTYWIKPTQNLTFFNVRITDTDSTSEEFTLARMFPAEGGTLLANRWYKGRILFREDPGTITGGNGIMNFDALKEIVFVTRDSELPIGSNTDMYIDDLQAVKYNDRLMLDAIDSTTGWTTTTGSSITLNTFNYRDASKAAVVFTAPNNNDGLENDYFAIKSLSANLSSYDVLSFWILVSKETDKMIFSVVDADGTSNYIRLDSILWGSQLVPGKWVHIEWPFKTVTDEISGSDAVMNYTNITKFQVIVNDNQMVKGISGNSFSFDNLEAMTAREWTRSKEDVPMLAPTAYDYAADRFQIGMYQGSNVQPEKAFQDIVKHGVDFLVTHVGQRNDISTKNAGLARKLGLKVVRSSFPDISLIHSSLDAMASIDSAQTSLYDPNNNTLSYLNSNELEVYWSNSLQSSVAADYTYLAMKTRANDALIGLNRLTNTHHINYLWYDTGEDLPWFMDWSTLGNYGGFKWTDRLKETAQRMGKTNVINTNSWSPSNLLTAMSDRNYQHVGLAPLNLDAIADFKDSLWTNFEGGINGIAFYIYDGSDDNNKWNFVDDDGNPMNDRRWAAVSDMSKQVRATEGKPYVELTYPRSFEVVEKGSVSLSAKAAPSGAAIASVTYEYNDGTNDSWTTIGSNTTSPYTVTWNTSGLDLAKKYTVRARSFDGTNYSSYDTSSFISLVAAGGPVISNAALSSNPTNGATSLVLTSTAADSAQAISQVQYYVDTVQKPGQGAAMSASDGVFNSLSEGVTATITIPALAATVPILIDDMNDISDWSGSATRNLEAGLLRLDVSNNNNGVSNIFTAIKDYGASLQNLSNLDTLTFWLKDDASTLTQLQVKLIDSDGTILQASLPTYYGSSSLPANIWKNIRWSFRENYDSISGGNGVFDYSNVKAIEFDVDDSMLPASGALQKIYIDQIRASAETRWQEETTPIVYVRAKNNAGNWGPTQSIKVNVTKSSAGDTQGPVTVVAGTNPHGITDGLSSFLLTANVDDGIDNHGGSQIIAAEYFTDSTGVNGTGTAMGAIDGSFDAMSESVIASVSAAAWAENSKHTFYIHGKDAAGNWGPFYTETIIKTAAQGPRIQNVGVNPSPTQGSTTVTVRAIADETETGWGNIAAGEYFVDTVGFEGTGTSMAAYDGAFSAKLEQATAQINISGWSNGYHTVYVHAKDSRGKWGALKSVAVLKN
ncbi:hypothetical protein Back11_27420 [Paenibacillus baekrokdamisoli]|uniref:Uncharacterized protein n=2 Tax=Paenibacillus baekrokdamisoli TaxID=1712516 RepID=A0A3G9IR91_9BACL|nr:Ig-like domain-containing protein [Paenibacillus baekrokdamisoli]BBH21397.1 hypothetical protein Back11_27420 [Paenibacillus baekrokdamisoli]